MPCVFGHDAEGASYDVNGNVESTGGFAVGVSFPELSQVENMIPHIETRGRCVTLKHGLESVFRPELEAARLLPRSAMHTDWLTLVWIVLKAKNWKFADHINLGETRSAVEVLEILAHIVFSWRSKVISLIDNTVALSPLSKGRSPSFPLIRVLRRRAALQLLTAIKFFLIWVAS